jgi:hypothetical protein
MWAPVFVTKDGRKFVFAYQDQLFDSRASAALRGIELQSETIDDSIVFTKEVINAKYIPTSKVTMINGFALCFLDEAKKKNGRGRRKKRDLS